MSDNQKTCLFILILLGSLLILILVPMSLSYVEYYEYGLNQRKTTGAVDITRVYTSGRYNTGPDHKFIKYQADAHYEVLEELSVFSAGGSNQSIGLEFQVDVDLTYFLIQQEVGLLHKELASNYRNVVMSRARDAIKNGAIRVKFSEYFQDRKQVEQLFRTAVQDRWDAKPRLHCLLDQFHIGRIRIPESVATKQLESVVQNERNDQEEFLQQAQIERELTAVEVNSINLERDKVLRTAEAEASLLRSKARSEAQRIMAQAVTNGTQYLLNEAGIVTQDHKTAFTYIQTLRNRKMFDMDVSYLSPNSVLRTQAV